MPNLSEIRSKIMAMFGNERPRFWILAVGLLLILAGYFAYSNFSKTGKEVIEPVTFQTSREPLGSISGGAIGPKDIASNADGLVAGATTSKETTKNTKETMKADPKWVVRVIERNSLKESTYKVQKGDTLWQIAQGKYGSGFEWTKILEANKDKVGFLPNGSQALIQVGQELSLP